ncbi:helix-turn-helix domain-containing protein [Fulvivirga sp.]|uniref:helix-turn-helix domain-containing protein n=1 Tax=Fulvivirga sp. TaxID=1931237 RepID=UPI0032EEACBB
MNLVELGERIKQRRKFLKISQQELADMARISDRTLRAIEQGKANPEIETLSQLCEVLGLQISIDLKQ